MEKKNVKNVSYIDLQEVYIMMCKKVWLLLKFSDNQLYLDAPCIFNDIKSSINGLSINDITIIILGDI